MLWDSDLEWLRVPDCKCWGYWNWNFKGRSRKNVPTFRLFAKLQAKKLWRYWFRALHLPVDCKWIWWWFDWSWFRKRLRFKVYFQIWAWIIAYFIKWVTSSEPSSNQIVRIQIIEELIISFIFEDENSFWFQSNGNSWHETTSINDWTFSIRVLGNSWSHHTQKFKWD